MVSVIIPVWNSSAFLEEAVRSVVRQTLREWEMILVDDGSTDPSGAMCDALAASDSRIRVVHKKNGGLSSARNAGLEAAEGDFIFFIDADDILPPQALAVLTEGAGLTGSDIICGKTIRFSSAAEAASLCDSGHGHRHSAGDTPGDGKPSLPVMTGEEALENILYQKKLDNSACGKLYISSLWRELRFREGTGYEDLDIIAPLMLSARSVASADECVYLYRQHPASYTHTFTLRRADVIEVTRRLTDYISTTRPRLLPAARSRELSAALNILTLISANSADRSPEGARIAASCRASIRRLRAEALADPSVRLKNKIAALLSYIGGCRILEFIGRLSSLPSTLRLRKFH